MAARDKSGDQSPDDGWINLVLQKWRAAEERCNGVSAGHPGEDEPWMTGLTLYHNGHPELTAATLGDDGYLCWVVEIHGGLLNNIMKGVNARTGEFVNWSPSRIQLGDELGAEIVRTRTPTPPRRSALGRRKTPQPPEPS